MSFETFEPGQRRLGSPAVSINKHGHWSLNKAFATELNQRKVTGFVLRFDSKANVIAMQPSGPKDSRRVFPIHFGDRSKDRNQAVINATSFLNWIEYDASKTRSFTVAWNEKEKQFEFAITPDCLKKTTQKKSSKDK
jgi:hypothetical protein